MRISDWSSDVCSSDLEKEYGAAISDTDRNLYKSAAKLKSMPEAEKWLAEQAKGANVMIQNAIKTFESIFAKEAESIYAEAAKEIDKKYKSSIGKMKRKAVMKIVGHVVIILRSEEHTSEIQSLMRIT